MAEDFCFALLRSTTLQVLKAAGFDTAHKHPTDTLTDVLAQYIQSLAATMSAYAYLSGRAKGSAYEAGDALNDMAIDLDALEEWLEKDGGAMLPCWAEQSDPGRVIEGMLGTGRATYPESLVYEYSSIRPDANEDTEDDEGDAEEEEEEEEEDMPAPRTPVLLHESLPSHIPPYLPPFPEPPKEEEDDTMEVLPPLPVSAPVFSAATTTQSHTMPVIVRTRRRPVENPFTHLTTFEESALAAAADTSSTNKDTSSSDTQPPLSLSLLAERRKDADVALPTTTRKRPNDTFCVRDVIDELQSSRSTTAKDTRSRACQFDSTFLPRAFSDLTQDEAAAGNTMFTQPPGTLDHLMRRAALPISISVLTAPNLLVDVAVTPHQGGVVYEHNVPPPQAPNVEDAALEESEELDLETPDVEPLEKVATPLAPMSLASLSKAKKRKTSKKLTISLPKSTFPTTASAGSADRGSLASSTPSSGLTTATPKIRFTIKAPAPIVAEPTPAEAQPLQPKDANSGDEIRCICENPTVDYGNFMIACDRCGVWFHGSCVGKAESDPSEDWLCKRCVAITISPTPDPTPTFPATAVTASPPMDP